MIKDKLENQLKELLKGLNLEVGDIVLHSSENPAFGDYTSNIALQQPKQNLENQKHSSIEIANEILEKIQNDSSLMEILEKVEVAGPAFINFYLKNEILTKDLEEIEKLGDDYGKSDRYNGQEARVEYVSANPTGPMQVGNGRGGPLGDSLANVLTSQGYKVTREYLHNDVGNQVTILGATIKALIEGRELEESHYKGEYVKELAEALKGAVSGKSDEEMGQLAVELNFKEIMEDCERLGLKFDEFYKESELRKEAPQVIEELRKKGVLKKKDDALWLAPSDEFLKDRETVVVKSDGGYTYFTADVVYHQKKMATGADLVINILGADHHGHVPRLQAAISALGFDVNKFKPLVYQYVRIRKGGEVVKLSKRAGNLITVREVLDEVGKDAFRFAMLSYAPTTHIDFDLDLFKEQSSKNPVYFVQYAHARMCSILGQMDKGSDYMDEVDLSLIKEDKELDLVRHLLRLPDLLAEIVSSYQVHHLTRYSVELAEKFHSFYEAHQVLKAGNMELIKARLALVRSTKVTLKNVLTLLGVDAPEKM